MEKEKPERPLFAELWGIRLILSAVVVGLVVGLIVVMMIVRFFLNLL